MYKRGKYLTIVVVLGILLIFLTNNLSNAQKSTKTPIENAQLMLKSRLEDSDKLDEISVGDELIHASEAVPRFYANRQYEPAWINEKGVTLNAFILMKSVSEAEAHGLRADDYHLGLIEEYISQIHQEQLLEKSLEPAKIVELELLLTDAFMIYGSHLHLGRVNPETLYPEWTANRRKLDMAAILQSALENNEIEETLQRFFPPFPVYLELKNALSYYKKIRFEGGWPLLSEIEKLEKGDSTDVVLALRKRLLATKDLQVALSGDSTDYYFDKNLVVAVKKFQRRHGLSIDGVVGEETLTALNTSLEDKICKIKLNMERCRWLPNSLGSRYILVNIAAFHLDVVEDGETVLDMKVIVGEKYNKTPVFSSEMTYLVFNPYWHVPPEIAAEEILPKIKRDSTYLEKENFTVFSGWDRDSEKLDAKAVDWDTLNVNNFSYKLRQGSGPNNALGEVKFMFPNKFSVYLHDTPATGLFDHPVRTFSHGCMRINKPWELAKYLLKDDPAWTEESIENITRKSQRTIVNLPNPIMVHVLYWTAWTDKNFVVNFRDDIYNRDQVLLEALNKRAPGCN